MAKKYCFYKYDRALHKLPIRGVVYLEASDNDVKFHYRDHFQTIRIPFKMVMEILYGGPFIQIHRSFAVTLEHLLVINSDSVIVDTLKPTELPLSKKYYPRLTHRIVVVGEGANGCADSCDNDKISEEDFEALEEDGEDRDEWV